MCKLQKERKKEDFAYKSDIMNSYANYGTNYYYC